LIHAEERTDRHTNITKPIIAFRKFTNPLKITLQNQTHLHEAIIPYVGLSYLIFYPFCN